MEMDREIEKQVRNQNILTVLWTYLKILLLIGTNIVVFLTIPSYALWILFAVELVIGVIIKVKVHKILPILKFIGINVIPIYFIMYFSTLNWVLALISLEQYLSKIFVLLLSVIIFSQTTPNSVLITSLGKIGVPKKLTFVITTVLTLIPTISERLRNVVLAQKARGYKINLFRLKPILVPTILQLMDFSINLSYSLESRGFDF